MKFTKKLLFLLLTFLLLISSFSLASNKPVATSESQKSGNETLKVFNTDLYLGGQDVVIKDTINGNVFAFGSTVTIKSEIFGDVFILAQALTIEDTATIHGNVFAFAKNSIIKGKVNYDVYSLGQDFELADKAYINRDIRIFAATTKLYGSTKKDAFIFAQNIIVNDTAKNIIGGNLHYTSDKKIDFPKGAIVGNTEYTEYKEHVATPGEIILNYVRKFIIYISYAIVIILLITFFTPKFIEKANYALMKKPFVSSGIGILSFVLIPAFALLFFFTGWLTSLSIASIAIYALIISISPAIFSVAISKYITEKWKIESKGKFILFAILVASALWVLQLVPFLGGYLTLFIYVVGLGVFLFSFFRKKNIETT